MSDPAAFAQAQALLSVGRFAEARVLLGTALRDDPTDAALLSLLAEVEISDGNNREAIAVVTRALAAAPDDLNANLEAARVFRLSGQKKKGVRAARQCVALAPDDPEAWSELAQAQLSTRQWRDAEDSFQRLRAVAPPSSAGPHFINGLLGLRQQQWRRAERAFRSVLEISPSDSGALHNLGIALRAQGHYDDALDYATRAGQSNFREDLYRDGLAESARASVRRPAVSTSGSGSGQSAQWYLVPALAGPVLVRLDLSSVATAAIFGALALWFVLLATWWRWQQRRLPRAAQSALEIDRRDFWRRLPRPWKWNFGVVRRVLFAAAVVTCLGISINAAMTLDPTSKDSANGLSEEEQALDVLQEQLPEIFGSPDVATLPCESAASGGVFKDAELLEPWTPQELGCTRASNGQWAVDLAALCPIMTSPTFYYPSVDGRDELNNLICPE